ncbi:uncharacterized protein N7459_006287 [Penicillium hispanicum]|uniref:uncharacterized protein n=1 Tax=Penicillium hispanicum TaxID=1080232 RepID=UPI00253F8D2B|nr:uncharacterized protein N7459_006287 [Penicillium hispanicum]KAJ5580302.1 hypothetical protein N7459_006287 [Penicillium hispanicum]
MKVTLKEWNAIATWHWDMPEDEVCGICRVQFDGTCPTCKFPGDECSLLLGKCGHSFHMIRPSIAGWCHVRLSIRSSSNRHHPGVFQHGHAAAAMSLNNPAQPPIQDPPSRPGTSLRPTDRYSWGYEDQNVAEAQQAEPVKSPTYDRATDDEVGDPANNPHDEGAGQQQFAFHPFFTLIEDAHTTDYHHPTVHYIFSDDDTDIVTEAALRSLETQQDALTNSKKFSPRDAEENPDDSPKSTLLPPPIPGVRENYIVLDIEPVPVNTPAHPATGDPAHQTTGAISSPLANQAAQSPTQMQTPPSAGVLQTQFCVTSAKSFSPSWQVLSSELVPAPTFENHDPVASPGHGLMLKIHGTGGLPADTGKEREDRGTPRLEDMMDQFAKRMRELQTVIDAADLAGTLEDEGEKDTQEGAVPKEAESISGRIEEGKREEEADGDKETEHS